MATSSSRSGDAEEKPAGSTRAPKNEEQAAAAARPKDEKAEGKSSGTAYLNVSGSPIVYDREGHQVGAGEWTPEVNLDTIGRSARKAGFLLPRSEL